MRMVIFGATGMVGQGGLRECLRDPQVTRVLAVGRRPTGVSHPKLAELVRGDFHDWSDADDTLAAYDACFFTLGVSAAGMSEADYTRTTYDLTLAAATALARLNPGMTFIYVSGQGTDSSMTGRAMWARVKGRTENALLGLPFRAAYMFRPGMIQPVEGVRPSNAGIAFVTKVPRCVKASQRRWVTAPRKMARAARATSDGVMASVCANRVCQRSDSSVIVAFSRMAT